MKKTLLLLSFLICAVFGFAQQRPAGLPSPNSTGYGKIGYQQADSGLIQQPRDTFPAKYPTLIRWSGDNTYWQTLGNGSRWFPLTTGTLRSIYAGYGLTKVNDSTLGVDTALIATRLRVQKAVDSLGVVKQPYNANTTILGNTTTGSGGTIVLSGSPTLTLPSIAAINVSGGIAALPTGSGTLAYTSALSPYKLISDTLFNGGYTTRNTTKKIADSLAALISGGGFGTVQSVSTTDGVGIVSSVASPTANPNISIRVDTGRATAQIVSGGTLNKVKDSLSTVTNSGLALKLNISDTAAMLTPNYRRTITKITNSDLVNSTISGTALGSNLPALSFGTYLQNSATSYNGTTANTISTNATSSNTGSTLVARDINGDFSARNISAALIGNASSASTVNITNDNTTNATMYPLWSAASSGTNSPKVSSSKITFNPNTGVLTSNFAGALTGNASSASVLQTPRTINGVAFDGSANISISASVDSSLSAGYGITGSPFNGSLGRTWVVDTTKIIPYTDTLASYGIASKSFVRSFGYGTGSVTSVATNTGSGITGGTITTTGTIAADTTILSTKANVTALLLGKGVGSVTSIATDATMQGGTIISSGTLKVDTVVMATRPRVQKGIDSVAALIPNVSGYKLIADSSYNTGYTTRVQTKRLIDSLASVSTGTGTVTSVATNTGSGITGGTITSTGTIAADTTILSTKANVTASLLGKVSSVSGTSPISSSGGATPTISISQSTTSTNGYLSSTDWNTFNGKQNAFTQGISGYMPKWTSASGLDTSIIRQSGNNLTISGNVIGEKFLVKGDLDRIYEVQNNSSTILGLFGYVESSGSAGIRMANSVTNNALTLADNGSFLYNSTPIFLSSGGTFTGDVGMGFNNIFSIGSSIYETKFYKSISGNLLTYIDDEYDVDNTSILFRMRTQGTPIVPFQINSNNTVAVGGRLNVNGATDNASYALNVTGAATFSSSVSTNTLIAPSGALTITGTVAAGRGRFVANSVIPSGAIADYTLAASAGAYGMYMGVNTSGVSWLQSGREDTNTSYELKLNPNGGIVSTGSRLNVNGAADNSLFSLNNGGGTTYTNGFSPNASNYTGAITLGGGTTYVYTGTGAVTWTLPTPSGNNQIYIIKNNGTGVITLNAYAAGQLIPTSSTTGVSSITISVGGTVTIQQDGSSKSYVMNVGSGSGTYTPTSSGEVGCNTVTFETFKYSRVGNECHVSGQVTLTRTSASTYFEISLPIPTTISSVSDATGVITSSSYQASGYVKGTGGGAVSINTNSASSSGSQSFIMEFTYIIK